MSILRGRFRGKAGEDLAAFASSAEEDSLMVVEDLRGSRAHATMLGESGIIPDQDASALVAAIETLEQEYRSGAWEPDPVEEDVHMAVEAELTRRLGGVGKKLHTARSRNDQVATDVRLWLLAHLDELAECVRELVLTLVDCTQRSGKALMAGYTHLQRGQPVWLGHYLLAHAWSLQRDVARIQAARERCNASPLGAGAMAGTSHPIDRVRTAALLGFERVLPNAMDAVAARDHMQETAAACAICMSHLSRMAEELIVWASAEFAFVKLAEEYTTGSSIMPQKRNPDGAELIRGKTGRVYGNLQALLVMTKGLPLAYNRDLQEDRTALFDAVLTTTDCVRLMARMWATAEVDRDRFAQELRGDFSLATELADGLAQRGVPFREAHERVGAIVRRCDEAGGNFAALTPEQVAETDPDLGELWSLALDAEGAAERRVSQGGTAWSQIEDQCEALKRQG